MPAVWQDRRILANALGVVTEKLVKGRALADAAVNEVGKLG